MTHIITFGRLAFRIPCKDSHSIFIPVVLCICFNIPESFSRSSLQKLQEQFLHHERRELVELRML